MTDATPQPAAPLAAAPLTPAEDKQWATFAHFGGLLGILPSLIIFLVFKDRGTLTRQESKEALNWQITWAITAIVLSILSAIITTIVFATAVSLNSLAMFTIVSGLLGFITWLPYIANLIFSIMGGVRVNGGGAYRYPVAIRLIK